MKRIVLLTAYLLIYCIYPSPTLAQKIEPVWNFSDFNSDPNRKGLEFSDLDNDGIKEVIMGSNYKIYVLRVTDTPYLFDRVELNCFNYRIGAFALADDDNDGDTEIFVVNLRGEVLRLDVEGDEITEEVIGDTDIVEPGAIAVADLNKDGLLEYIIGPRSGLFSKGFFTIYNLFGPQFLYGIRDFGITDVEEIELADVNGDFYLDIIHSPKLNYRSLVIDGKTFNVLNDVNTIAGLIEVADLDGNGALEIVNVKGSVMRVFDAQSLDLINSFELEDGITSLCLAELDGNPGLEALVGSDPSGTGDIYCYNPLTNALLWKKNNIAHATELSNIKVFDIDKDGTVEIVFGALDNYSGVLVAMDTTGNTIEYESMDFLYPVNYRIIPSSDNSSYELFLLTNEYRGSETAKVLRQFSLDNFNMINQWELQRFSV